MLSRRTLQLALTALVAVLALSLAAPAGAVGNPDYTAPPPTGAVSTPPPARQITSSQAAAPSRQRLPITGSDTVQLALIGGLLVAGGAGLVSVRRSTAA
jgi:LPXTG-motif cell wall-anchored protein